MGKELSGDLGIVDGVEEAEEAGAVLVTCEVFAVDLRGDSADALAIAVGGEDDAFGMLEERVLLRAESLLQLEVERADVARVVSVDDIDDVQKVAELSPHRGLANGEHEALLAFAVTSVN